MTQPTFTTRWNAELIDQYYVQWLDNPENVDPTWRTFFEGYDLGRESAESAPTSAKGNTSDAEADNDAIKQSCFTGMIYAYRALGHSQATINPILHKTKPNPRLALDRLGFEEADLDRTYWSGNYLDGLKMSVRELIDNLETTYCRNIGVEYLHIQDTPRRRFLQAKMEPSRNQPKFSREKKLRILDRITKAEEFEHFLHKNYVGQKRFGLEGGETIIAALDAVLENAPSLGIKEIVFGMAHRGRLNVLSSILRKSYEYIFHEFSENFIPDTKHGDGDVKYHLGFDATVPNSRGEEISLHLAANPSHLEAVNPVVEGRTRALQRIHDDTVERKKVIPILIHGDAAFAGQGVIAEVLNFSQLPGYETGGTVHFIINNQIGFTTDPSEARSTTYCTDVAKMIEAPIFHVNGDDPEAVIWATEIALEYRQTFGCDVVIDMYCYRRHGHNESDEPAFTQPTLYKEIKSHPSVVKIYGKALIDSGICNTADIDQIAERWQGDLKRFYDQMRSKEEAGETIIKTEEGPVAQYQPAYAFKDIETSVPLDKLTHVAESLTLVPKGFNANPKIKRQVATKLENFKEDKGVDWAFAESLAWGTLMLEGHHVRLSGQDCVRGTFSQRHAFFFDSKTREKHIPLMEMEGRVGKLCVHNSLLSEAAVLGFDYGYSLDYPEMLCMWEAQFGDFVNGAQVIIDQFISSSESKWRRVSGLVMLLPHGYEGQGPEHSSARLERFLQLCAEDNIQVANLTTPAQYFHILRRQMKREFRKPLIIMTPKSLLRHKDCVSSIADFTETGFSSILGDTTPPKKAKRVILCSGKVYYDLMDYRRENKITDTAIVRIEQFYPLNAERLTDIVQSHGKNTTLVWCQEEPQNQGAWTFLAPRLEEIFGKKALYSGRDAAASPAVGNLHIHKREQNELVAKAFSLTA